MWVVELIKVQVVFKSTLAVTLSSAILSLFCMCVQSPGHPGICGGFIKPLQGCLAYWITLLNFWLVLWSVACSNQDSNLQVVEPLGFTIYLPPGWLVLPTVLTGMGFGFLLPTKWAGSGRKAAGLWGKMKAAPSRNITNSHHFYSEFRSFSWIPCMALVDFQCPEIVI